MDHGRVNHYDQTHLAMRQAHWRPPISFAAEAAQ
jgi:hypothetical protein